MLGALFSKSVSLLSKYGACTSTQMANLETRIIFSHVFKKEDVSELLNPATLDCIATSERAAIELEIKRLILRRCCDEPMSYITGTKEFWSLPFIVNRSTLIPRPDSETIVEVAKVRPSPLPRARPLLLAKQNLYIFLDVMTGTF